MIDAIKLLLLVLLIGIPAIATDQKTEKELYEDRDKERMIRRYLLYVCIVMYIIISFRDYWVGRDTLGYINSFLQINTNEPIQFYSRDYGYAILNYCIRYITNNQTIYFLLVSWPLPAAFYLLMKDERNSCVSIFTSFIILMVLEIFAFSMAGIRQTIAIFFTVLTYKCISEKRNIIVICLTLFMAIMFHMSALVFAPIIILRNRRFGILPFILFVLLLFAVLRNPDGVFDYIHNSFFGDEYWAYGTVYKSDASFSMLAIQGMLFLTVILNRHVALNSSDDSRLLYNLIWMGIFAQALTPIIAEFFRISFYFSIYLCVLVPRAILTMSNASNRRIFLNGIIIASILYMMVFNNPLHEYNFVFFR